MDFQDVLTQVYLENPCQVLPNALWKTLARTSGAETALAFTQHIPARLTMWAGEQLLVSWSRAQTLSAEIVNRLPGASLGLIHQAALPDVPPHVLPLRAAYFRLGAAPGAHPRPSLPPGFVFQTADPAAEASLAAGLINACYPGMQMNPEAVHRWTAHPVFAPALWVWVIDQRSGDPAGLGIGEFDPGIREGSLEWVQVLPAFRGQGLGTALVCELLARLADRAVFTTVSGRVDNQTHPESLYRRCGFGGEDIWWVLQPAQPG